VISNVHLLLSREQSRVHWFDLHASTNGVVKSMRLDIFINLCKYHVAQGHVHQHFILLPHAVQHDIELGWLFCVCDDSLRVPKVRSS